ncbi:MAG: metalloregulator ArsR/SmtB family transcription factor [Gammaproteobacteria bacterium]|nr:metalloregulator ArsR/SmtB family transcription factor [Gammaproteobacteria bacterium]
MNHSDTNSILDLASVFKVLSEPNRLKIVLSMGLECTPVSAIIAKTGLSQTNVSFHLRVLREAGLVKGERNGPFIFYCLYDTALLDILTGMTKWREQTLAMQTAAAAQTIASK